MVDLMKMTIKLRNKKISRNIFYSIAVLVFAFTSVPTVLYSSNASAVVLKSCGDTDFNHSNDVLFYEPCVKTCSTDSVPVATPVASGDIAQTETVKTIYAFLTTAPISTNGGKPFSPAQAAGIMGNMYVETNRDFNPSTIEDTSRAEKGHGIVQWTFGRWHNLESFAAGQGKPWDDLQVQLDFLKTEVEGPESAIFKDSEFTTTTDPSSAAMRWRVVFERADPNVAHDGARTGAAVAIFNMFGGAAAAATASVCTSNSAAVSGDFVKTAINYALEKPAADGTTTKESARDTYQVAKEKFNPGVDWTDCGGFVATALIASGVDESYPKVSVAAQLAYVKGNTEKYSINENPTMGDLKPGDIMYVSGHTTIYTGEAGFPMVDASLGERVPSVRTAASLQWMFSQSDLVTARLVK